MKQSRSTSLLKSLISTAVGLGLSIFLQWLILPMLLGIPIPLDANLKFAALMTAVSIARGYLLERFFEWMGWRVKLSPFMHAVLFECGRQRDVEGWSIEHDDEHERGELARAGACYALGHSPTFVPDPHDRSGKALIRISPKSLWPWDGAWWKPQDFRRDMVRSAALIIAEGDKFDRSRKQKRRAF
jgi:hypothetical protein